MRYVPTVTGAWERMNLEGVDEVLLTPSKRSKGLPKEPKTIIIDNGCFILNIRKKPPTVAISKMKTHLELCKELSSDPRCIFVLPDYLHNTELNLFFQQEFLREIKPKRYSLVDTPMLDETFIYHAEFLCIPARHAKRARFDLSCYHLFGRLNGFMPKARSWDDLLFNDTSTPMREIVSSRSY
jgi:hypothetical protein